MGILWVQGIIVTLISLVYLFMPNVSSALFLLTDLTAMLYLVMYVLLFSAAIRLRYKAPDVPRSYKIPGGNFGMWCVAGIALLGALFAIGVGLVPPAQLAVGSPPLFFVLFLVIGLIVFISLPLIIIHFRKPSWKTDKD